MDYRNPGFPVLHYLPEFAQTHIHWVSDTIQPFHPLSLPFPPVLSISSIRVFSLNQLFISGGQSIGVSASASDLPMNTQDWPSLGWTDWLDLLAVQGTLKSLLQHHSSKALIISWQIEGEKVEIVADFLFLGSKITADGDSSHEIRGYLLLGRKAMTNLDGVLKS